MNNVILIGMPGAGKSTVGVLLAKSLLSDFTDTDLIIQNKEKSSLADIINSKGTDFFIRLEEDIILSCDFRNCVVATGGSVVYGEKAMEKLSGDSVVVYLKVELPELQKRLGDITTRGIAMADNMGIPELFRERTPLYEKYADVFVSEEGLDVEETVELLVSKLQNLNNN